MTRPALVALALLASVSAVAQPCPEPSALDLSPAAPPLRLERDASGDLALSWEDVGAPGYLVHEGSVAALGVGTYDHALVASPVTASAVLPLPSGDRYFLVSGSCRDGDGSTGRDSNGRERPPGGLVRVTVSLQDGLVWYGFVVGIAHPAWAWLDDADVTSLGPWSPGSPGDPLEQVGQQQEVVTAAASFRLFDPDPSVVPTAGVPVAVVEMLFRFTGATPEPADFPLVECDVRDVLADPVPGATCLVTGFELSR